ncbi:hypothetical protein EYF80_004453 [Liparis tanakae]|uniref:Uncharacterized protein n=1 Tax=Liparis tanakae TaxID=230148 RepID=A0A4Z2J679_9TELE|nr:hypothetical protein EYF80_004453 [Liparis tanakae]
MGTRPPLFIVTEMEERRTGILPDSLLGVREPSLIPESLSHSSTFTAGQLAAAGCSVLSGFPSTCSPTLSFFSSPFCKLSYCFLASSHSCTRSLLEGLLQNGSWNVASDISRSSRVPRISSRLGGDMRGLRTWAPLPAPRSSWFALTWDSELMERGELLGVVDVSPSMPSRRSPVGEPSWSTNDAELKGKARGDSPLLSSAAPSSWGMDRLANRELFPLHSMSSSEDSCCSSLKQSSGSFAPGLDERSTC